MSRPDATSAAHGAGAGHGAGCACGVPAFATAGPGPAVDFGPGAVGRLAAHVQALGALRVLVVTDPGLRVLGVADDAAGGMRSAGIDVEIFDEVPGNPTTATVATGAAVARTVAADVVVALGGGSSLDAAKGIALLAPDPELGVTDVPRRPGLPVIAVPTTAGTGAETNGFGVLEDAAAHRKVYCGDASVTPRVAVLDPLLTHGLPVAATAATGVDALVHGIESLVSRGRTPESEAYAAEAVRRAWRWLPVAVADGSDAAAREQMLVAAHLAGQALTRSGLGLVHGLGHAVTAHTGAVHGRALAAVLPGVVTFSLDDPAAPDPGWERVAELVGTRPRELPDVLAAGCAGVGVPPGLDALADGPGGAGGDRSWAALGPLLAATAGADPVSRNAPRTGDAATLEDLLARCR